MRRHIPLLAGAALALAAAAGSPPAAAGTLDVNPVLVEIPEGTRGASVTVRNLESVPVTIRAYPLAWSQAGGSDIYAESSAIIVSPPVFTIAPGAAQTIRVGRRGATAGPESWRLIVEEVPEANPAGGIRVALRLNLPLYLGIAPGTPSDLQWHIEPTSDGGLAVEARNIGAGWVRADAAIARAATGLEYEDGFAFGTILPGGTRRWVLGREIQIADRTKFEQLRSQHGSTPRASRAR